MYEMDLLLDINSDLYPVEVCSACTILHLASECLKPGYYPVMQVPDKFSLALSTTLHRNNEDFSDYYDKVSPACTSSSLSVSIPLVQDLLPESAQCIPTERKMFISIMHTCRANYLYVIPLMHSCRAYCVYSLIHACRT